MTIDTRLQELAPEIAQSKERTAAIRAQVLTRAAAVDSPSPQAARRVGRRWLIGGVLAVAAAGALVFGPVLNSPDAGPFAANALTPLAQAAKGTEVSPLTGGRVLHRTTEHRMTEMASGKTTLMQWEEWTRDDGRFYRQTTVDGKTGPVEYWDVLSSSDFTPRDIADLPTDPGGLIEAIRESSQASSLIAQGDAVVRELLGAIIYRGYAPTKVWAAAIEAYGSFDDVQVHVDVAKNRTFVTEVAKGGPLTMQFDSATGQLLGYDSTSPQDGGRSDTMRVTLSRVEDGVPPSITENVKQSP